MLPRSREELEAARLLTGGRFHAQSISRAYYAVFYAAEEALRLLGVRRSKHAGVISAFRRYVIKEGGFDDATGALLHLLFEQRNEADYEARQATPEQAEALIADAERFVTAVEAWLAARGG